MMKLKFKILCTNISRIIRSVIFINLSSIVIGINRAFAVDINDVGVITCYDAGPHELVQTPLEKFMQFISHDVFIILVPLVIVILLIIFIVKKIRENIEINKEAKKILKEKHDKKN